MPDKTRQDKNKRDTHTGTSQQYTTLTPHSTKEDNAQHTLQHIHNTQHETYRQRNQTNNYICLTNGGISLIPR